MMEDAEPYIKVNDSLSSRKDLLFSEKLLLGLIAGLSTKKGYCDASNAYLARRLGSEVSYISKLITTLGEKGLLSVVIDKSAGFSRQVRPCSPIPLQQDSPIPSQGDSYVPTGGEAISSQAGSPMSPGAESYPPPGGEAMSPQAEHIVISDMTLKEKKEIKSEILISEISSSEREPEKGQLLDFQSSFQSRNKDGREIKDSPAGMGKRPRPTLTLRTMDSQVQQRWDALEAEDRAPYLETAERELASACGSVHPPALAVQCRAFNLFTKEQAQEKEQLCQTS